MVGQAKPRVGGAKKYARLQLVLATSNFPCGRKKSVGQFALKAITRVAVALGENVREAT